MPENRTDVTAAGIARLAGVGRAAVSNWRRRHADFPQPVGGTDTSPVFDLADVERWLRDQGKLVQVPLRERVWQQIERDPDGAATALRLVGAVFLLRDQPTRWQELVAADDRRLTRELPEALAGALRARLGEDHPVPVPSGPELTERLVLLRGGAELANELGARQAYEFLMGRHLEAGPRQYTLTPAPLSELMAELAGPAELVLDPACGFGGLLCAAGPTTTVTGQEVDPDLAALTALRLALHTDRGVRIRVGDSLRADAHTAVRADAVLCHPPFNERSWGHEELAYDTRWEYGLPPRTESELAWVQHALAHVRENGCAVLLMPPAAASRRSGRRIRADLLRRGALRAVVALPAGVAPPYGIPLHLWVLRRPAADAPQPQRLLLVNAAERPDGGEKLPWQELRSTVLEDWYAFDRDGAAPERSGVSRVVPLVDLLDDDVDVTPARHLPIRAAGAGEAGLSEARDRLTGALQRTVELTPVVGVQGAPAHWPMTSIGELARTGALLMRTGGAGAGTGGPPVLTEHDIVSGGAPSGVLPEGEDEEPVLTRVGDVVIPVLGRGTTTRVIDEAVAGAALGRNVHLLRPDPATLDPWFLAGFLRSSANNRQASSFTTSATRLDVRRLQVPRLPLADQRRYGERFRAVAAFEEATRLAARLGELLVQGLYDGLTDGSISPS
ncbi:N-6 DNA methylase [Streptomyces kaniharaensis]|uniref:N-6 DNA methylase n=1 Tax=Streptomyces kaniharaensis TaxID=212423 RepID=A0A6N7KT43_9ACTN|nr:N-6 DNA methylase [Streptomyces kaniharaensis]MQS13507.1 N-6 DNA methylase [Streptomyces kaniharaensis]